MRRYYNQFQHNAQYIYLLWFQDKQSFINKMSRATIKSTQKMIREFFTKESHSRYQFLTDINYARCVLNHMMYNSTKTNINNSIISMTLKQNKGQLFTP